MLFNLFKKHAAKTKKLTALELQDLISRFFLHMVWSDGKAEQRELDIVVRILTHDYHTDPELVIREINDFNPAVGDIDSVADELCNQLPVSERIQLLRDIWAIALTHAGNLEYEEELFNRAARHLDIPDNEFLARCVKVKRPGH